MGRDFRVGPRDFDVDNPPAAAQAKTNKIAPETGQSPETEVKLDEFTEAKMRHDIVISLLNPTVDLVDRRPQTILDFADYLWDYVKKGKSERYNPKPGGAQ